MTISIPGDPKDFSPSNSENYTKIQRSRRNFAAKQTFTTEREEARIRGTRKWLEKRDLRVLKPQHLPSSTCDRFEQFSPTNRNCRQLTTHYQRRKPQIGRIAEGRNCGLIVHRSLSPTTSVPRECGLPSFPWSKAPGTGAAKRRDAAQLRDIPPAEPHMATPVR